MDLNDFEKEVMDVFYVAQYEAWKVGARFIKFAHLAYALILDPGSMFVKALRDTVGREAQQENVERLKNLVGINSVPDRLPHQADVKESVDVIDLLRHLRYQKFSRRDTARINMKQFILCLVGNFSFSTVLTNLGVNTDNFKRKIEGQGTNLLDQLDNWNAVLGRDMEIKKLINILYKEGKHNILLTGDSGVGKTSLVYGLGQRIIKGDVPDYLRDAKLITVDSNNFKDLKELLESMKSEIDKKKVILFVDDLHLVFGKLGKQKAEVGLRLMLDMKNLLCICAITSREYTKCIEAQETLKRRFFQVSVPELSVDDTLEILRYHKSIFESRFNVLILDSAMVTAVKLSVRYMKGEPLPEKAVDLVEHACGKLRLELERSTDDIDMLERKGTQLESEYSSLETEANEASQSRLVELQKELKQLVLDLKPLMKKHEDVQKKDEEVRKLLEKRGELRMARTRALEIGDLGHLHISFELGEVISRIKEREETMMTIGPEMIEREVSERLAIPLSTLKGQDIQKLMGLEDRIRQRIIGQQAAVESVVDAVIMSRTTWGRRKKPNGSFLFLGPTGVGKTELAKALAEELYGDEDLMIRFDMSEFRSEYSVSRFIGGPPRYKGHDEGGQLTNAVKKRPNCVILFDEVDKADVTVFDILLQVLDDGRLTDGHGVTVDFTHALIIMTSNHGAEHLFKGLPKDEAHSEVLKEVCNKFRPEFLNRLDVKVVFEPLAPDQVREIACLFANDIIERAAENKVKLQFTEEALNFIATEGYDMEYGARPLERYFEKEVALLLSKMHLSGVIELGSIVEIDANLETRVLTFGKWKRDANEFEELRVPKRQKVQES